MKKFAVVLILTVSSFVCAQTKVDQGKPGTQGPWPVTCTNCGGGGGGSGWTPDGGFIGQVTPVYCSAASVNAATAVSTASVAVPAATTATRVSILVCNSLENTGLPLVKCRDDNTAVALGVANPGETINPGDCIMYNSKVGVRCISNTASTAVTTFECVP